MEPGADCPLAEVSLQKTFVDGADALDTSYPLLDCLQF